MDVWAVLEFVQKTPWWLLTLLWIVGYIAIVKLWPLDDDEGGDSRLFWIGIAFLLPFSLALRFGPTGSIALIQAAGGSFRLEWEVIGTLFVQFVAFVAIAWGVHQLFKRDEFSLFGLGGLAYFIGSAAHVLFTKGEPFTRWFS